MTESILAAVTRKCFTDPIYLAKVFFSGPTKLFFLAFAPFHKKIIKSLVETKRKLSVIIVARGFGKTNLVTVLYAIWSVFLRKRRYVILVSYSQPKSSKNLRRIRNCIKLKLFREFFKFDILIDNVGLLQIKLSNGMVCTFEAKGVDQPIFGAGEDAARPDLIILDDLEDLKIASKPERVQALIKWFSVEINYALSRKDAMGRGGQIILIGTPLDMNSFLAKVMTWKINKQMYPALHNQTKENPDGESIWPEMWSTKEILDERDDEIKKGQYASWLSQMMLDPGAMRVLKFEYDKMVRITPEEKQENLKNEIYDRGIYITVDMAYTVQTYSDYTGITVCGHRKGNRMDFLESMRGKWTPEEVFNILWDLKIKYERGFRGIFVETTQFKVVHGFFREYSWRVHHEILDIAPVIRPGKYYTQDKDSRIGMLVPYYNYGLMRICEEDNYPLVTDLTNWDGKNAKELDVADAASFNVFFIEESRHEKDMERDLGDPRYSAAADIHLTLKNIEKSNKALSSENDYFDDVGIEGVSEEDEDYGDDSYYGSNFLDNL